MEHSNKRLQSSFAQSSAQTSENAHLRHQSVLELPQTRATTSPDPPFLARHSVASYMAVRSLWDTGLQVPPGRRGGAKGRVGGAARCRLLLFRRPRRAAGEAGSQSVSMPTINELCCCLVRGENSPPKRRVRHRCPRRVRRRAGSNLGRAVLRR